VNVLQGREKYFQLTQGLNSWMDSASDLPDFSQRQKTFQQFEELAKVEFDSISWTLMAYHAFHVVLFVSFVPSVQFNVLVFRMHLLMFNFSI